MDKFKKGKYIKNETTLGTAMIVYKIWYSTYSVFSVLYACYIWLYKI